MANAVEIARRLADIASRTRDPRTAQELIVIVNRLLTEGAPTLPREPPVRH